MSRNAVFTEWHDQPLEEILYQYRELIEDTEIVKTVSS